MKWLIGFIVMFFVTFILIELGLTLIGIGLFVLYVLAYAIEDIMFRNRMIDLGCKRIAEDHEQKEKRKEVYCHCQYCGSLNKKASLKCERCGASLHV